MRFGGIIPNSVAIVESTPLALKPRLLKSTVNTEIEIALLEFRDDDELKARLSAIDNETAVSESYSGDCWAATFTLRALTAGKERFAAMNAASEKRVRKGIYGAVLQRLGAHRTQRIKAYAAAQRIAAQEVEKEDASFAVSGE